MKNELMVICMVALMGVAFAATEPMPSCVFAGTVEYADGSDASGTAVKAYFQGAYLATGQAPAPGSIIYLFLMATRANT